MRCVRTKKYYPTWSNDTGWSADVSSGDAGLHLPPLLEARLRAAYAPYNQQLFDLLGKALPWRST